MKNLIIIGARGYGREVHDLAKDCSGYNTAYTIKGFLDDKSDALDGFDNYPEIISSVEAYEIQENDVFVCALGSVQWKKYYIELILSKGGKFINLVHPTSFINTNAVIGNGVIIFMYSNISNDCVIEDFVTIQGFVGLGHDTKIGKWSHLNTYRSLSAYKSIGTSECNCAKRCNSRCIKSRNQKCKRRNYCFWSSCESS
jgi:hypothetical protein